MSSQLPSSLVASPQARARSSSISSMSTVSDISEWEVLEPLSPQTSPFEEIPPWSPKWVQQIHQMAKQSPQPAKQQQPYTAATKSTCQLPVASKEPRQHLTTTHAQPTEREPSSAAAHTATGELPVTSKESSAVREVAGLREQWEMEKKKERERIQTKVERKRDVNRGEEANALMDAETAKFYNEQSAAIKLQKESEWRMEYDRLKQKKIEQQMEHKRKQRRNPDMQLKKEQEGHARVNQATANLFNEHFAAHSAPRSVHRAPRGVNLKKNKWQKEDDIVRKSYPEHEEHLKKEQQMILERKMQMKEQRGRYLERKTQLKSQRDALAAMAQAASGISKQYPNASSDLTSNVASNHQAPNASTGEIKKPQPACPYQRLNRETTNATPASTKDVKGEPDNTTIVAPNSQAKGESLLDTDSLSTSFGKQLGFLGLLKNMKGM